MSVDCIVADDNPLLDFISIKNLNLNLLTDLPNSGSLIFICPSTPFPFALQNRYIIHTRENMKHGPFTFGMNNVSILQCKGEWGRWANKN
jgi:hypothetical protein